MNSVYHWGRLRLAIIQEAMSGRPCASITPEFSLALEQKGCQETLGQIYGDVALV